MFLFAITIGFYSYFIFFIGILGLLNKTHVYLGSIAFFLVLIVTLIKIKPQLAFKKDRFTILLGTILILQILVNLIGVLGPETSFDALWYHLTLPKIFIQDQRIHHISGGLLNYSDMPKLAEMLYIPALFFGNEIVAKFIHFSFGLLSLVILYKLSRRFLSSKFSLLVLLVFYANLVVAWESTVAYVDLALTFFIILALLGFMEFLGSRKKKYIILLGLMMGLALSTKIIAIFSFFIIFGFLIYAYHVNKTKRDIKILLIYSSISIFIALPWLIFSFLNTGSPFYPFLGYHFGDWQLIGFLDYIKNIWTTLTHADDPISPIYLIFLPLVFYFWKALSREIKLIFIFFVLGFLSIYFFPHGAWARYIVSYLPAFSLVIVVILEKIRYKLLYNMLLFLIFAISLCSIVYRALASAKYLPVIFGFETKQTFLTNHLNFSFGDFYDTDNYFKNHIRGNDRVLLIGFHNLYYVDFPYIDSSWKKKGDFYNYVATQNTILPSSFKNLRKVYENKLTRVTLYKMKDI